MSFRNIILMLLFLFLMPIIALGMLLKPIEFDDKYYTNTAKQLSDSTNYKEVQNYYKKTIHYCDSTKNWKNLILTNHWLAELYILQAAYDKADSLLLANEVLRKKKLPKNTHLKKNKAYTNALLQFKQGDYKRSFKTIEQVFKLKQPNNKADSLLKAKALELKVLLQVELNINYEVIDWINEAYALRINDNNILHKAAYHYYLGYYFFKIKDYVSAKTEITKSLAIRLDRLSKKHPLVADCEFWLGKIYLRQGDLQLAINNIYKTLNNTTTVFGEQHPYLVYCYEALAQIGQHKKNNEEALDYYSLAINKHKTIFKQGHPHIAKLQNNLAHLHETDGNYKAAYKNYNFALLSFKQYYGTNSLYYVNCLNNIALLNQKTKKYKTAIANFEEAIAIAEKKIAKHDILQKLYYNISLLYNNIGSINRTNIYLSKIKNLDFEQCIEVAKIHFGNGNYNYAQNVLAQKEADATQSIAADQLKYFYWKAKINYFLFEKETAIHYLDTAVNLIHNCNRLIKQRRKEVGDLISYNEDIQPIYKLGIQVFSKELLFKKDSSFINLAFQFINESKANALLQNLNETKAKLSYLPENLIEKEKTYQQLISKLEKEKQKINPKLQDSITEKILATKSAYNKFKVKIEKDYPIYYELKYDNFAPTIKQIQSEINGNTTVLEYFLGDSLLYLIQVEKDRQHFYALPKPSHLLDTIDIFIQSITNGINTTIHADTTFKQFTNCATTLYQNLLQKPLKITNATQLIIIPDKQLNNIPFDLLLTTAVNTNKSNYKALPYVLNQHAVSYLSSSTFLIDKYKPTKTHYPLNYIGYAPEYETAASLLVNSMISQRTKVRGNYDDLEYARIAVTKIDSMLNSLSSSFIGETATIANFKANINRAKIQHFAMHGIVNKQNPLNSHLVFSDDSLTIADLYNLNIETDLAVLTACNTGSGLLQEGEGIMSLSRAFTYAGCPSLIMSLWSLPDEQTAKISEYFFQNLKDGFTKHQALQQAKIKYLQTDAKSDRLANPFFWGGLVATGNMDAIFNEPKQSTFNVWLTLLIPLSLLTLILFWLRKKGTTKKIA